MARRKQSDSDSALATLVRARYEASASVRSSREAAWQKARELYDPSYVDRTKVKDPPYVKVPYVWSVTNTYVESLLTASEANGCWVKARAVTPEQGDVGFIVSNALERQFRYKSPDLFCNNEDNLECDARQGCLYGNGWAHLCWYENGEDWGIRVNAEDPSDVFPDWKAYRWVIIRRWMTVAQLRDLAMTLSAPTQVPAIGEDGQPTMTDGPPADGGRAQRAFKLLLKQVESGLVAGRSSDIAAQKNERQLTLNRISDVGDGAGETDGVAPETDPYNVRVEVLNYRETTRDGIVATVVPGFGGANEDLVFEADINDYGVCTVVPFLPFPIDKEVYGYGTGEISGNGEEVLSYLHRAGIRFTAKVADQPLIVNKSLQVPRNFLKQPSGKSIEVMGDPRSAAAYLAPAADSTLHHVMLNAQKSVSDIGTGFSDQRRGSPAGGSATAVAVAESFGTSVDRYIYRRWKKHIEQIGHVMLAIMRKHITEPKAIAMLGRDADQFLTLRPEHLKGSFIVEFGGSPTGMNPQQQISAEMNFFQSTVPGGFGNGHAIARHMARTIFGAEADEMVMSAQRPKVSSRHEETALFLYGQDPEVHPEDNDQQHIMSHLKASMAIQQADPVHPKLPVMEQHVRMHMIAMQQKQAAAQGMGTGSAPAMPGPGQPMSVTPSTQQAVDTRQESNRMAAGAAPGGVASNRPMGAVMPSSGPVNGAQR